MSQLKRFPYADAIDADGHIFEPLTCGKYSEPQYPVIRANRANLDSREVLCTLPGGPAKYILPGQYAHFGVATLRHSEEQLLRLIIPGKVGIRVLTPARGRLRPAPPTGKRSRSLCGYCHPLSYQLNRKQVFIRDKLLKPLFIVMLLCLHILLCSLVKHFGQIPCVRLAMKPIQKGKDQ
jgi:hypothetical protein